MIASSEAVAFLKKSRLKVLGIAVVGEVPREDDGTHTFVRCDDQVVRIHWDGKPNAKAIAKATKIVGAHCDPIIEAPEIIEL